MRIAWCTPFHEMSPVARVSRVASNELAKNAQLDIWYEPGEVRPLTTRVPTRPLLGKAANHAQLAEYDAVIYSMGDHLDDHAAVYEALCDVPGVVIMHDASLARFFAMHLLATGGRSAYLGEIERWHGHAARSDAERRLETMSGPRWRPDPDHGLVDLALENALAVITHSRHAAKCMTSPLGNTEVLALPYAKFGEPEVPVTPPRHLDAGRVVLLMFGPIHSDRRADAVVRAMAADPAVARRATLVVAGPLSPKARTDVEREIATHALEDSVRLVGHLDDASLRGYIGRADACIDLRRPVVEAASSSLIEAMWHGKPALVFREGWYAELPDDTVVRVGDETDSLASVLQEVIRDREMRRRVGERAREYARSTFLPAPYADGLHRAVVDAQGNRPMLRLADQLRSRTLELGLGGRIEVATSLARATGELFEARRRVSMGVRREDFGAV